MKLVSPRVRLPLVELRNETKAEIEAVFAQISLEYSHDMIGSVTRPGRVSADGVRRKRTFAVISS
jgi:hypothetical protein